jgi:hypothetical protein
MVDRENFIRQSILISTSLLSFRIGDLEFLLRSPTLWVGSQFLLRSPSLWVGSQFVLRTPTLRAGSRFRIEINKA